MRAAPDESAPAGAHGARRVLDHRIVYVSGKGGVGKSTIAAAIALAGRGRGHAVVVAEVARRTDVQHVVTAAGADHVSIDPQQALEDYLADQLPVRALADMLVASRTFTYLAGAAPGLRELVTAGMVWELGQDARRKAGDPRYDLVVVDAPATGHGIAVLTAPRTFASAARVGPIARQADAIGGMLSDPERTALVAVTTPEELPVNETLALRDAARAEVGLDLSLVVANAVRRPLLSGAERERVAAAGEERPAIRTVLAADNRGREHAAQLERLRAGVGRDVPVVEVAYAPAGPDPAAIAQLLEAAL
jgi:anion-transporting  ArsA/GET3 family ATPase